MVWRATIFLRCGLAHLQAIGPSRRIGVPRGPSTSKTRGGSILVTSFLLLGGSSILKLTSGGTDTAAEPIREAHRAVFEKDRLVGVFVKAGTRNSGSDEARFEGVLKARRGRLRATIV